MFDDIIQKKKEYITIYAPYIPLQNCYWSEELEEDFIDIIAKEIDEEIVKLVIKEANRS